MDWPRLCQSEEGNMFTVPVFPNVTYSSNYTKVISLTHTRTQAHTRVFESKINQSITHTHTHGTVECAVDVKDQCSVSDNNGTIALPPAGSKRLS